LAANAITAATGQVVLLDGPWLGREPVLVIPGFDDHEWASARASASSAADRFEVVFTGRLYENYRRPDLFLRGLRLAAEKLKGNDQDRLRFVYYGPSGQLLGRLARDLGCSHLVDDRGFVDPATVPHISAGASVLLLLTNEAGDSGVPGGKFFEYLAAHRPILAVPGGDQYVSSVLSRTGAGREASDEHQVAEALLGWFAPWRRDQSFSFTGDLAAVDQFSARTSTRRLAELLDGACVGSEA
jgi:hypothetical protein